MFFCKCLEFDGVFRRRHQRCTVRPVWLMEVEMTGTTGPASHDLGKEWGRIKAASVKPAKTTMNQLASTHAAGAISNA